MRLDETNCHVELLNYIVMSTIELTPSMRKEIAKAIADKTAQRKAKERREYKKAHSNTLGNLSDSLRQLKKEGKL